MPIACCFKKGKKIPKELRLSMSSGRHGFSNFRNLRLFKFGQISLLDHGPQKNESIGISSKNFMQVGIDAKYMDTNICGRGFLNFGDTATFKNGQFFLSDHGLL